MVPYISLSGEPLNQSVPERVPLPAACPAFASVVESNAGLGAFWASSAIPPANSAANNHDFLSSKLILRVFGVRGRIR